MAIVVLVAAIGRLVATSESHTLSDAGSVAAIVAGAIALLLLLWGVGRWMLLASRADDIAHGLHIEQPKIRFEAMDEGVDVYVGLDLRNGIARPLSYQTKVFRLTIGDRINDLAEAGQSEVLTLGPGAPRAWFRDPIRVRAAEVPGVLRMDYEIVYGSSPRKMRRAIRGQCQTSLRRPAVGGLEAGVWDFVRPERDTRLKRR
jgi:hypothetical protein